MIFGVIQFPGSNCDQDAYHVLVDVLGQPTRYIWHKDTTLGDVDCVVVPGGFSYGDYLRTGAIARFSPAMKAVIEHAKSGGLVLGICNGFQILCEAHLLPGRADSQSRTQIPLRTYIMCASKPPIRLSPMPAAKARSCASPLRTGKATISPNRP